MTFGLNLWPLPRYHYITYRVAIGSDKWIYDFALTRTQGWHWGPNIYDIRATGSHKYKQPVGNIHVFMVREISHKEFNQWSEI